MKELEINNKIIKIYYKDTTKIKLPVVILNTYDEDGEEIYNLINKDCILVTISNINWNSDMSPWYMDKLFEREDNYSGNADSYLDLLINKVIPEVNKVINNILNKEIDYYVIAGYSLAGLFAIYSMYKTNTFKRIASVSGSLWYPNIKEYITNNFLNNKPELIYFSLGNKEKNTKNLLMSKVEDNTKYISKYYNSLNIITIYEENEGNHFKDINKRISKAIDKVLE